MQLRTWFGGIVALALALHLGAARLARAEDAPALPRATIDGNELGFKPIGEADLVNVNGDEDTWTFKDGLILCKGSPTGVIRTKNLYTNFELVIQWRHLKEGGNSGVFVWTTEKSIETLKKGQLPKGVEVQVLDHGYTAQYEKSGKKATWFTSNGDVFPVGVKLTPFPPLSPDGSRSFPRKNLSKGVNEWNHYYVRGVNGEVRLWVNGEEVSGGTGADPRTGYICLESEGAPVEFKEFRIRELP